MPLTADDLRRIAFLARESPPDYWRRFCRERGMPELTEKDIEELDEMDRIQYPWLKCRKPAPPTGAGRAEGE